MLQLLKTETEKIERALQTLDSNIETITKTVALLNEFEMVMDISKSTRFVPETDEKTYRLLLESEEIFNVEDGFLLEACDSIGLEGPLPIIVPGKGYYFKVTEVLDKIRVVEMPIIVGPRLGLLPILYRLVSEIFVEKTKEKLFSDLNLLATEIKSVLNKSTKSTSFWSNISSKPLCLLNELAADLIATKIGGPAYFYALLRGLPSERRLKEGKSFGFQDKLCILRIFLQERDIELRFMPEERLRSELVRDPFVQKLVRLIKDLDLPSEYSRKTHESDMPEVKLELMVGEVRPIEPSIVANALWDTVFDKEGYLNENAAFLSVLEWTKSSEIFRKTWEMNLPKAIEKLAAQ